MNACIGANNLATSSADLIFSSIPEPCVQYSKGSDEQDCENNVLGLQRLSPRRSSTKQQHPQGRVHITPLFSPTHPCHALPTTRSAASTTSTVASKPTHPCCVIRGLNRPSTLHCKSRFRGCCSVFVSRRKGRRRIRRQRTASIDLIPSLRSKLLTTYLAFAPTVSLAVSLISFPLVDRHIAWTILHFESSDNCITSHSLRPSISPDQTHLTSFS